MELETKRLMHIATTYEDPQGNKEKAADTRKRARECVLFDLENAGQYKVLWQMQFEERLGKEFQLGAGLAAVEVLAGKGRIMELMHYRGCSPFHEVNMAIADEIIRDEMKGRRFTKSWQVDEYRRMRRIQLQPEPIRRPVRQVAAA